MIKEKIQNALNDQLNAEIYSAYLYLSMAAYFHSINLKGFANWMEVQYQEEMTHAMKFYNYLLQRGGRVILKAIESPPVEWESPLDAFKAVYAHEQKVTGLINNLVELALEEKDHATHIFLQWFVTEQVEEEESADEVVQRLLIIGDSKHGMFMLDRELGMRTFTPPADDSQ